MICGEDMVLGVERQKEGTLLKLNRRQTTERPKGKQSYLGVEVRSRVFESPALSSQTEHTAIC